MLLKFAKFAKFAAKINLSKTLLQIVICGTPNMTHL